MGKFHAHNPTAHITSLLRGQRCSHRSHRALCECQKLMEFWLHTATHLEDIQNHFQESRIGSKSAAYKEQYWIGISQGTQGESASQGDLNNHGSDVEIQHT